MLRNKDWGTSSSATDCHIGGRGQITFFSVFRFSNHPFLPETVPKNFSRELALLTEGLKIRGVDKENFVGEACIIC